jgi:thiosulfate reductase/polysulfide reductase chain A
LYKENAVWINAVSALKMGISQDQYVVLVNQDGVMSNPVKARVTQRIRKDCVFMVHGFGSMNRGLKLASGRGADDQKLITKYVADPISGSTGMRVNFIKIVKVSDA